MRKRGAHFNRRSDPHAGLHALAMNRPLDAAQKADESIALRVSLEALRTGMADESAFHTITAAINVSLVLCEWGVGADYEADIKQAQAALLRVWTRSQKTGRWLFDGAGWQRVLHAVDLHEAQLASISRREASEAMREVIRRIDQGNVFEEQRA